LNSERTPDGKTHYYLFDNLDSVVGLTDSSIGNKDNSYDDDPYGQIKAQQEGESNPWKFASGSTTVAPSCTTSALATTTHHWVAGRSKNRSAGVWAISTRPTGIRMPTMIRSMRRIRVESLPAFNQFLPR